MGRGGTGNRPEGQGIGQGEQGLDQARRKEMAWEHIFMGIQMAKNNKASHCVMYAYAPPLQAQSRHIHPVLGTQKLIIHSTHILF
jgi:hypothetical protein